MDVSDIKNSATDQFGTLEINQPCKEEEKKVYPEETTKSWQDRELCGILTWPISSLTLP